MELVKFFHRLWNPHCPHCMTEDTIEHERQLELRECKSCEVLKTELEYAHRTIDRLTAPKVVEVPIDKEDEELKPIPTTRRFVPMAVRNQMQDAQDRKTLELLIAANKKVEVTVSDEKPVDEKKVEEMERDILSAPNVVSNG